jgi:predicted transcriptional regulator
MRPTVQAGGLTKHEQLLQYIRDLKIGQRISVRQMAKALDVSEGTAYRAIKEAEQLGIVSTRERIGTVRIEKQQRNNIDRLTFAEVVNMVDGEVLGGAAGLEKKLGKFVIGAMEIEAMVRYIEAGGLLIVGNRSQAQRVALEQGAGVLITGGFKASPDIVSLADERELPIISSSYDTFTVASMINRAVHDRLIKKQIVLVEDLVSPKTEIYSLRPFHTVKDWNALVKRTGYSRFPVVDEWNRVLGIVTPKDTVGAPTDQTLDKVMTRNPHMANRQMSIASAAHMMVWEGIELLPVVDHNRKLIGVLGRQDVLRAMQYIQQQPQTGETFEDMIWSSFEECRDDKGRLYFKGTVLPQMTNHLGTVSEGVLSTLIMKAAYRAIKEYKKGDLIMDNLSTYFVRPLQIDSEIVLTPDIIEVSRKFGKVEIVVTHQDRMICKAMLTAQVLEQS